MKARQLNVDKAIRRWIVEVEFGLRPSTYLLAALGVLLSLVSCCIQLYVK